MAAWKGMSSVEKLQNELQQLLLEQAQAESEAEREYEARREEVRTFLNTVVLTAYRDLSLAFGQHGLGRQVQFDQNLNLDHPEATIAVRGPARNAIEFIYVLLIEYGPRHINLSKRRTFPGVSD